MGNFFYNIIEKLRRIINIEAIFKSIDDNFVANIIFTAIIIGIALGLILGSKKIISSIIKKTKKSK